MGVVHKDKGKWSVGAMIADIQGSAGSVGTAELANDAVTYAKIQNVSATDRLLGRDTAAAGDVEELTVGGGIEFTGSGGIQTSAFTGDVTKSAGGTATTIANNAVLSAMVEEALVRRTATVTLTQAQVQALNTTPVSLISAPGSGKYIVLDSAVCLNTFDTAAFEAGTNTLDISYTNAAGADAATFTNAFLESGSTAIAVAVPVAVTPVENAALVASCNSDPTGGGASSTLKFQLVYHVVTLP